MKVILVGCGSQKRAFACQAQYLYFGQYFRIASEWAKRHCDEWGILSAKHHLLRPDQIISPYTQRLSRYMKDDVLLAWGKVTAAQLRERWPEVEVFHVLLGEPYRRALTLAGIEWKHCLDLPEYGIDFQMLAMRKELR